LEPIKTTSTLTKGGAGTLTLSGANTYTGATTISAGTLQLGDGGTTGTLSTSSTIMNNGTFTINRSDAVAQGTDFSGSVITGTGGLTQTGAGVTTLTVANTYSGATTVSAGTLLANNTTGSATGSGNVTVQTGARLGGSGLVGLVTGTQNITVNSGGFLGIGNTGDIVGDDLGLLTSGVGVITFNGTLEFDIYDNFGGTANLSNPLDTNDLLNLTSDTSIVLSGTLKVTDLTGLSSTLWVAGDTWRLLDWSNVTAGPKFSGGFTTLDLPDLDAGLDWLASTDGSGFYIAVIVVPEPSRAVLLLAGFMVLVLRRRPLVNG
jgi:fibronectin-binding autotransporter adhesin